VTAASSNPGSAARIASASREGVRPERRRRRTQEERSAETRALLLDVTLECLAELGYAGATSQVIAERAGLSRGAQLHHFGSKAQLVTAAMEHLFERRVEEFRRGMATLPPGIDPTSAAIDLLWEIMSGPTGYAYLELVSAARTDRDLRTAMIALTQRLDQQVEAMFKELFTSSEAAAPFFDHLWTAVFALLEGLAFEKIVRPDDERLPNVLDALKQLAPLALRMKP
jgi:AcrR family transcriptional regulator